MFPTQSGQRLPVVEEIKASTYSTYGTYSRYLKGGKVPRGGTSTIVLYDSLMVINNSRVEPRRWDTNPTVWLPRSSLGRY